MRSKSLILLLALAVLIPTVASWAAKSGQNSSIAGDYDVVFKGTYEGQGSARVNGSGKMIVWIKGDLNEVKQRRAGRFKVKNMPFTEDGHFSGTGTYICQDGTKVPVTVEGRLEPGDNALIRKSRIICTFVTDDGAGRILGSH
jgi:hypothetical protein